MNNIKRVLFICKHNRFRSKVAEALFNKYNSNKNYIACSGGLLPGKYPLNKEQVKVAREFGIKLVGKPKPISTDLLSKTGLIIIVADNVKEEIFEAEKYGKEIITWKIRDDYTGESKNIRKIIANIEKKLKNLLEHLK